MKTIASNTFFCLLSWLSNIPCLNFFGQFFERQKCLQEKMIYHDLVMFFFVCVCVWLALHDMLDAFFGHVGHK